MNITQLNDYNEHENCVTQHLGVDTSLGLAYSANYCPEHNVRYKSLNHFSKPQANTLDEILINLDAYKLNRGGIMGGVGFSVAEHYAMYPELKSAKLTIEALIAEAKANERKAITQAMLDALPERKQMRYVKKTSPNTTTTDESKCRFYRYGGYDFAISEIESAIKKIGGSDEPR